MKNTQKNDTAFDESMRRLGGILANPSLVTSYQHTTPLLERARLRRMGLDRAQAKQILDGMCRHGVLDLGVREVIARVCLQQRVQPDEALRMLLRGENWPEEE